MLDSNNGFQLESLRGGLDDTSPHMALAPDACITAENVEFVDSMLGERRRGCDAITLYADFASVNLDAVTWMYRHLPGNTETDAELWALAQSLTTGTNVLGRRNTTAWATIAQTDAIDSTLTRGHRMSAQTLHGKLFIAYKSAVDRMHVYDGTSLRRTNLAEPAAPTAANTGAGSVAGYRFYRVRYLTLSGTTILRKSEPSDPLGFSPSGTGLAVRVTKPAAINEGETHWEVEGSMDVLGGVAPEPGDYYTINGSRQVVATTTFDDTTTNTSLGAEAYAVYPNELSDDVGDYTVIPSGKFLAADEDRLLIAGSWENTAEASRVRWTPVYADPGVANDERLELGVDPYLDLDGFDGGEITGMSHAVSGYIFVFKRHHIYRLVRNNSRRHAYDAAPITKVRGALPGSLVEAVSQNGMPSVYFLDPDVGPTRISRDGLQWCGRDIQTIWQRVNIDAKVPCHGVYYNKTKQVHYWIAVDGADYPNMKIVLHVNEMRDTEEGGRRGWVTVGKDNRIATAHCSGLFADNTNTTVARSLNLVPFIGKEEWIVGANTIRNYIQICDTGSTDAHTTGDTLSTYRGVVTSKPFALAGIMSQHEVKGGAVVLKASDTATGDVYIKVVRDFGKETQQTNASFYTTGGEEYLIVQLTDLGFSELYTLQISLGDLDTNVTPPATWGIDLLQLRVSRGIAG